ncbi:MAG: hypothetical protein M8353_07455 [ANME-2 cluster archaeon]|nr:hypothetical protein [ANME-2 cluster archaeon]
MRIAPLHHTSSVFDTRLNTSSFFFVLAAGHGFSLIFEKGFTNETTEKEILSKGLTKYDEVTFYDDMGIDSTSRRVCEYGEHRLKKVKTIGILVNSSIE